MLLGNRRDPFGHGVAGNARGRHRYRDGSVGRQLETGHRHALHDEFERLACTRLMSGDKGRRSDDVDALLRQRERNGIFHNLLGNARLRLVATQLALNRFLGRDGGVGSDLALEGHHDGRLPDALGHLVGRNRHRHAQHALAGFPRCNFHSTHPHSSCDVANRHPQRCRRLFAPRYHRTCTVPPLAGMKNGDLVLATIHQPPRPRKIPHTP